MSDAALHGNAPSGVQSVERALAILEILARCGDAGVTDIASEIGVHKSTAFRLLAALENSGLVEQVADRGKYRLGMGILRLAGATTARLDVVQEARPICRALAATTGETVNIAVLADGAALYVDQAVDQAAGKSSLQAHNWVGQHIPLHATSNGKVLLSELPDAEFVATLGPLAPHTAATITTRRALREQLALVREQGYAEAVDELEIGLKALAAPIRNAHGDVVASISVSGPTFRLGGARSSQVLPQLLDAAGQISLRLGWHPR